MDQPKENEVIPEQEIDSPCSSDKENSSSAECQKVSIDLPKSQNMDVNDNDDSMEEELDFEDERRETDLQKYVNVLQTSVQQNINSDSRNGTSPGKNASISMEDNTLAELKNTNLENSDTGKENCGASDIEEGETVDDDGECVDVEDGEIDGMSNSEDLQKYSCRFFQRGKCIWGKECRYLHLSDKGLYNMFDSPLKRRKPPLQNICFVSEPKFVCQLPPPLPPVIPEINSESVWDRALNEAKERIKQSKMRKEDECFEEKVHMKIEKNDRLVDKSKNSGYSRRPISPVPVPGRIVCAFSNRFDSNKSERLKHVTTKPNLVKSTSGRKIGYDSEWRDPWRRSKTPPKRKRLPSKSFSDSSKSSISTNKSNSSWETRSRDCRSPSPKRYKSYSRRSRSRSYCRKASPARSVRRSSCSYSGSTSTRSRSSSREFSSSRVHDKNRRKKLRLPSSSPVYSKRNNRRSHDSIVLPYRRRSRSISQPTVQRRVFQKIQPVERKHVSVLSQQSPTYHSRSGSPSSSKSAKRDQSGDSSCSRSRSDMSISPISDSSLSRKSNYSDKDLELKYSMRGTEVSKIKKGQLISKVICPRSVVAVSLPRTRSPDKSFRSAITPVSDAKITLKTKKRIQSLEMELLKYQADFRKSPQHPPVETQLLPKVAVSTNSKIVETELIPKNGSNSTLNKTGMEAPERKPSKRDLLMQQLKAVEDAIARKKKSICST